MTPIAAYFIFTADEQQRAAAAAHKVDVQRSRLSLLDRIRGLAAVLRLRPSIVRSA